MFARSGACIGALAASFFAYACGANDAGGSGNAAALTYCDVAPILQNKCQRCHTSPPAPLHGAPFPLLTYDDTQQPAPISTDPGRKRAADMLEAVESNAMPYMRISLDPPVSPLTCEERATLLGWLRNGSPPPPASHADCSGVTATLLPCSD